MCFFVIAKSNKNTTFCTFFVCLFVCLLVCLFYRLVAWQKNLGSCQLVMDRVKMQIEESNKKGSNAGGGGGGKSKGSKGR